MAMVVLWMKRSTALAGCPARASTRSHPAAPLVPDRGRGRDFREEQALLVLQADDIGKRATNVNGDLKHGERPLSRHQESA